jgi:hypothetical protein
MADAFTTTQIGEGEEREYAVQRYGTPWLYVAISPFTYAISWPGTIIKNLDRAVRFEVPEQAGITPPEEFTIRAILQEPREYRELHLPQDDRAYRDLLKDLRRVSFIRYDNHKYSFTAGQPTRNPELAVRFRRDVFLTTNITAWMLQHHREGNVSTTELEDLLRSIE